MNKGRRTSNWQLEKDDHEVVPVQKINFIGSLSPSKEASIKGRKPRLFASGFKFGVLLTCIFFLLGFQGAIFNWMGF